MKYEHETDTFDATVGELRAVTIYASDDITRPHMASVMFDREKQRVAATDGHRMIVLDAIKRPEANGKTKAEVLVNARALQAALKGLGAKTKRVKITCESSSVTIECEHVRATLPMVDATYPPIDNVMPDRERSTDPARAIGFNASYLRDLGVVADIRASHKQSGAFCELRLGAELDPARVDADLQDEGRVTIVLMPARI